MVTTELAALYTRDLRRLTQEIRAFPDTTSLWQTMPGISNAAGTLALHLEGNLREYIARQLGGIAYTRDRAREFGARGVPQADLIARVEAIADAIPRIIARLSDETLSRTYPEQVLGIPLTTRHFLIHLSGHLNYHLGQIDYLRRMTTGHGAIAFAGL